MTPPPIFQLSRLSGGGLSALALWSGLLAAGAQDSTTVINEVMYHPAVPGGVEWIELHNQMSVNMDLSGWRITGGVNYTFAEGTTIPAGEYLVVASHPAGMPGAVGPWIGSLDNSGETIELENISGRTMDGLTYSDSGRWPVGADGSGATLAKRNQRGSGGRPESWVASWQIGGTPGARNFSDGLTLGPSTSLSQLGGSWRYLQGADLGANWAQNIYTAGAGGWQMGAGAFAFDEAPPPVSVGTVLADPSTQPNPICYFQKSFTFSGNPASVVLTARILVDDGAVMYLNGNEIHRQNMPAGPLGTTTRALTQVANASEITITLPSQYLLAGTNLLSVSLHEGPPDSALPSQLTRTEEGGTMDVPANLALASHGAVAFAKDLLGNGSYAPTHTIPNLNNGGYGNGSSWIGNSLNSFCGVSLGASPVMIGGLAFGRDNTGGYGDRTNGTYTVQSTTVPNPSASTPEGSWTTVGTLSYAGAGSPFFSLPSRRHRYEFPAVAATGLRLICPGDGINTGSCVDELEIYGARLPDAFFDFSLSSQEILPQPSDSRIVINEISGTVDALFRIEMKNEGSLTVDLTGMQLGPFTLPAMTLAPGALVVFDQNQLGFRPLAGDRVFLLSAGGGLLLDGAVARSTGRARLDGRMLVPQAETFGSENVFSLQQDIVINEIMYRFPPNPSQPEIPAVTTTVTLLPLNATWRYHRSNLDLGSSWAQTAHAVGGDWFSGQALLGFETTPASLPDTLRTPFATSNASTYYFETDFSVTAEQLNGATDLRLEHVIDDGAAFYLDGVEITNARFNLPAGFTFSTPANAGVSNAVVSAPISIPLSGINLQPGTHRLSVEVHQQLATGNDMVCGARLSFVKTGTPAIPAVPVTANPEEWIELHNRGTAAVALAGWKLDGEVNFIFPTGVEIAPGGFLVVAKNAAALKLKWPEMAARIFGDISGSLTNSGGRIQLEDAMGNPADELDYLPSVWSDGSGSSLELRDPRSDNANPEAWADSNESGKSAWQTFTYRMTGAQNFGPTTWNEIRLGMLDAGECLIDDFSVRANPDGAATQLIQNGNFESLPLGSKWRLLGNHRTGGVIAEPGNPGNHVLRLNASGPTETNHNHAESTFLPNAALSVATIYEVSFRARWLAGTNQLNTRAYYEKLARTHELPIPQRLGTPGSVNSRWVANSGPIISSLTHAPAIPQLNAPVTVSFSALDPDGAGSATLFHRVDGALTFTPVPMSLSNGQWTAGIPGQSASGAIVQFYVEVLDDLGAATTGPAAGSASRALVQWSDGQTTALSAGQLRLIMLTADRDLLLNNFNRLSNERIPGSFVEGGREIFYDVGVRLQGTAAGRVRDGDEYVGYDIGFPPDHLFRGLHDSIGIDRSGRTPVVRQQDEIYVRHTFQRAGIPCPVDDLCYFVAPQPVHTGTAILQLASYGGLWADSQYRKSGTVFNLDITYDPTTTSVVNDPESLKPPVPFVHVSTDFANLGDDKEQYRGPFDIRAGKRNDDYRALISLCKTMALPDAQLATAAPTVLDLDEVLRCTALVNLWGIGDSYYTGGGLAHNIRLFTPDDGTGIQFLPWDMDFTMSGATNSAIIPPTSNNLGRLINNVPGNRRLYLGHIRHLCATAFNSSYLSPWLAHYGTVVGQNFSGTSAYIDARCATAQASYPAPALFSITTNGGADFSVAASQVILEGAGWIDIREILRTGSLDPVATTWLTNTTWRITVPLVSGPNVISLEARDFDGALLSTKTITVTNTLIEPSLKNLLRVTELHYHPANPSTASELAASATDNNFEFIEVRNIGNVTLSLNGLHFGTGVDFVVANGLSLSAGQFGVIVRNRAAFEARYGTGTNVLGEYLTDGFSNSSETVTLLDFTGAIIQSFTYQDAWFPRTDGPGWSMVVADEGASAPDLNAPSAWAISCQVHGNPGAPNGPIFSSEFEGWRHQHFTSEQLADPGMSAREVEYGGLSNLLRYGLGLTPYQSATERMPGATVTGNQIDFSYRRLKKPLDIQYEPEASDDLETWVSDFTPLSISDNGDGTETVTVRFVGGMKRFVRLRLTGG